VGKNQFTKLIALHCQLAQKARVARRVVKTPYSREDAHTATHVSGNDTAVYFNYRSDCAHSKGSPLSRRSQTVAHSYLLTK